MKTYDINEAADFLKVDRTTALSLAGTGELPGAKIGRAWVFLESDLVEYLRDKVRRQTNTRRDDAAMRQNALKDVVGETTRPKGQRRRANLPRIPGLTAASTTLSTTKTR